MKQIAKQVLPILGLTLLTLNVNAQKGNDKEPAVELSKDFSYSLSKPYLVIDGRTKEYFGQKDALIAVKFQGKKCIIQKFEGKTLNEIKRKEYEDFPDGFVEEDVLELDNHYYVYYSVWDKKRAKNNFMCVNLILKNVPLKIREVKSLKWMEKLLVVLN